MISTSTCERLILATEIIKIGQSGLELGPFYDSSNRLNICFWFFMVFNHSTLNNCTKTILGMEEKCGTNTIFLLEFRNSMCGCKDNKTCTVGHLEAIHLQGIWRRKSHFSEEKWLFQGKVHFSEGKLTFPRKSELSLGKVYFTEGKWTFPRESKLFLGKVYFTEGKFTFPRESELFLGKVTFLPLFRGKVQLFPGKVEEK